MAKISYISRVANIVNKAEELGYEPYYDITIVQDLYAEASDYILYNCEESRMEHCELDGCECSQSYIFIDSNDIQTNVSGEIFHFANFKADDEVYYKVVDGKFIPVDWFEINEESKKENTFVYVFDTIVDSNGDVIRLYDYF
ncbi:MAG: hypothetical protein HUK07_05235 [Bacteroidaceae bacterium]|nr:hypothetical protein [Bacteroidaceae bacterium]